MQCWKAGAALAHKAFSDDGRFTDVNELNFRLIATQGVQVTVGNRTYEGAATMLKPLGPNYIDNARGCVARHRSDCSGGTSTGGGTGGGGGSSTGGGGSTTSASGRWRQEMT